MKIPKILAALLVVVGNAPLAAQQPAASPVESDDGSAELAAMLASLLGPEQQHLREPIASALAETDQARRFEKLDALVNAVDRPSPVHAFLAATTASELAQSGSAGTAKTRFAELLRIYPSIPGVRLQAVDSLAYTSEATEAARLWIELAQLQPQLAKMIDGYTFGALSSNLLAGGNRSTNDALMLALDGIGYDPGSSALRTKMLEAVFVTAAADQARGAEARSALRRIDDPVMVQAILANRAYEHFWSDIAQDRASWIARTERYVAALGVDAGEAKEGVVAGTFFRAAHAFAGPEGVLDAYLSPLKAVLASNASAGEAHEYAFWVASIAYALVDRGNAAEAERLLRDAGRFVAGMDSVNRLNVTANFAAFLVRQGRHAEALTLIEPAIAELDALDTAGMALVGMHAVRAKALHGLRRDADAETSLTILERAKDGSFASYVDTLLEIGRIEAARAVVIENLGSPGNQNAIDYFQPPIASSFPPFDEASQRRRAELREDDEVRAALDRVGRIVAIDPIAVDQVAYPSIVH